MRSTLWQGHADRLQIWIKAAWGTVISMRNIVSELWSLAADFASFSHYFFELPPNNRNNAGHLIGIRLIQISSDSQT